MNDTGTSAESRNRWKPVLRDGVTYCSPGCGRGCTWEEYQAALRGAEELAESLGNGWRPEVWENLGWFFKAESEDGTMSVHPPVHGGKSYTAFFERSKTPNIQMARGNWHADGPTPQAAINAVLVIARDEIATIQHAMASFERTTGL